MLALNSQSPCFILLSARIVGIYHHDLQTDTALSMCTHIFVQVHISLHIHVCTCVWRLEDSSSGTVHLADAGSLTDLDPAKHIRLTGPWDLLVSLCPVFWDDV